MRIGKHEHVSMVPTDDGRFIYFRVIGETVVKTIKNVSHSSWLRFQRLVRALALKNDRDIHF